MTFKMRKKVSSWNSQQKDTFHVKQDVRIHMMMMKLSNANKVYAKKKKSYHINSIFNKMFQFNHTNMHKLT